MKRRRIELAADAALQPKGQTMSATETLPKRSPWGRIDGSEQIAPGFWTVSTPGHGGVKLDRQRNAKIPAKYRQAGGWYEEDCEYSIPFLAFSADVLAWGDRQSWTTGADQMRFATRTAKNWEPDFYQHHTGEALAIADSYILQRRAFDVANVDNWVTIFACCGRNNAVPDGMVGVCCTKGGKREADTDCRYFLVPDADYDQRRHVGGFVVDDSTAEPWVDHPNRTTKRVA